MAPTTTMGSALYPLGEMRQSQRADGLAAVLAIGTANPPNCVTQEEFPDFYFRATNSDHLTALKDKFKRICQEMGVQRRYLHHTEEMLSAHPDDYGNMSGATVIFALDELRRQRKEAAAAGEWPELGVMMAFGPGMTVDAMLLHATSHVN
uniref:Chalcone/stilbene synthase N-terminal domain-containing protein n=1 Tax=Oryza barthii TaxID=65489 RepID=A0A0D3GPG7_9ORYZ